MDEIEKKYKELWEAVISDKLAYVVEAWTDNSIIEYADSITQGSVFHDCGKSMYLSAASNYGAEKVVDWLIDNNQFTQLGLDNAFAGSCAGRNGKLSVVKKLYEAGANPIAKTHYTNDIWYYVKNNNLDDIQDYLKSCGAEKKKKEQKKRVAAQSKFLRSKIDEGTETLSKPSLPLVFTRDGKAHWNESYVGKTYFLPQGVETPTDKDGKELGFVLQINLENINQPIELPEKGILQFFVKNERYRWDHASSVLYHQNTGDSDWAENSSVIDINTQGIAFSEPVGIFPWVDSKEVHDILKNIKAEEISELDDTKKNDIAHKHCRKKNPKVNNFLKGHPYFIQDDPRMYTDRIKNWILLMQLDGFDSKNELWGRNSTAYWFISPEDLQANNFDSVYFCYQKG